MTKWTIGANNLAYNIAYMRYIHFICLWLNLLHDPFGIEIFFLHRIAQKREEAVAREIMKKIADDKKMNKKEKDERYNRKIPLSDHFFFI